MRPRHVFAVMAVIAVVSASVVVLTGDDSSTAPGSPTTVLGGSTSIVESTLTTSSTDPGTGPIALEPGIRVGPGDVPDLIREGELPPPGYRQLLSRDAIRPVYEPVFVTAGEINWSDDDLVLGVEIDGDARAYSIAYLNQREMVIDRLASIPVLVTW